MNEPASHLLTTSLRTAQAFIYRAAVFVACTAIAAMVVLTFVDVLGRHFFSAVPGASEIVSMLLGIAFYGGMTSVQRANSHIVVGLLVDRYPPGLQKVEAVVTRIVSVLSMALIAWLTINQAGKLTAARTITEFLGLRIDYLMYFMGALAVLATIWAVKGRRDVVGTPGVKR